MKIRNMETGLIVASTLLWVGVMLSGWSGHWLLGMMFGLLIMLIYMVMGSAKNGVISRKLLVYPLLSWFVVWVAGFLMADKYAIEFSDSIATFSILGFHPSFSFIIWFYWIGGVLTLTLGLNIFKDEWLSESEWESFKEKVEVLKEAEREKTLAREEA